MRTIEIKIYKLDELSEKAQEQAILNVSQRAYDNGAEADWQDANDAIKHVKELARIDCDIRESSQGFYVHWGYDRTHEYDKSDKQLFKELVDLVKDWKTGTWADEMLQGMILEAKFNKTRSYVSNVSDILVSFCDTVYSQAVCNYYAEDYVREFVEMNDIEFHADGTPYN